MTACKSTAKEIKSKLEMINFLGVKIMSFDDILAIICVFFFGGFIVSCYYINKYEKAKPPKDTNFLKLQRKITGIISLTAFIIFAFVNEDSKAEEIFLENHEVKKITEENFSDAYLPGQYKIGKDISAGEYLLIGDGYFEIMPDSSGDISKIIVNDNFKNRRYVSVRNGEYLKVVGDIKIFSVDKAPKEIFNPAELSEGQYKISDDIPAGEYKITANENEDGYFEVTEKNRGIKDILKNGIIQKNSSVYITVEEGQYIKIQRAKMEYQ